MSEDLVKCRNLEIELIINQSLYDKKIISYDMYVTARELLLKLINDLKGEVFA